PAKCQQAQTLPYPFHRLFVRWITADQIKAPSGLKRIEIGPVVEINLWRSNEASLHFYRVNPRRWPPAPRFSAPDAITTAGVENGRRRTRNQIQTGTDE